jgi:cytochrome c-type biogenesis protein CcmE
MRGRRRLVIAVIVAGITLTMVLFGTWQSAVPFISPADVDPSLAGRRLQVEGIVQNVQMSDEYLTFELSDGGEASVPVVYRYRDQRPLTLEDGRLVIAKGFYQDGILEAQQVSVRAHEETIVE